MHIPNFPFLNFLFVFTTFISLILLFRMLQKSDFSSRIITRSFYAVIVWIFFQIIVSRLHVYSNNLNVFPPRIVLFGIFPPLFFILFLFFRGKFIISKFSLQDLHAIHVVRIPVEIGLLLLAKEKVIPEIMSFEGQNFDILAGLTAPFIVYYGFIKRKLSSKILLLWNILCLGLLLNIVVTAFLAAPTPFQQIAFEQPNKAVLFYPYSLLPTFIVPIVLFSHLVSIKILIRQV